MKARKVVDLNIAFTRRLKDFRRSQKKTSVLYVSAEDEVHSSIGFGEISTGLSGNMSGKLRRLCGDSQDLNSSSC